MTTYEVDWGTGEPVEVDSADELAAVLDRMWSETGDGGVPYMVSVSPHQADGDDVAPWEAPYIMAGVGHPERAWVQRGGDGYGVAGEPDFPPPTDTGEDEWAWDWGGQWTPAPPWKLRVRPQTARALLLAFISGGDVPGVEWTADQPTEPRP